MPHLRSSVLPIFSMRRLRASVFRGQEPAQGNISAIMKITRLKMKSSGPDEVELDTDKPGGIGNSAGVIADMIDLGLRCRISPVGEMLSTDLAPLRLAAQKVRNAALPGRRADARARGV
jgi:hypothetical protein